MTLAALLIVIVSCLTTVRATAGSYPTSHAARVWHPDRAWLRGAFCVHNHESADWHRAWTDWRGSPSLYAGGLQFLQSTWRAAGGRGEPWEWSPREQFFRAFVTWRRDGGSWSEWGSRGRCGLA